MKLTGKPVDTDTQAAIIWYAQRVTELENAARDALEALRRLPNVDGAYRVTCIKQLEDVLGIHGHDQP